MYLSNNRLRDSIKGKVLLLYTEIYIYIYILH